MYTVIAILFLFLVRREIEAGPVSGPQFTPEVAGVAEAR
jgi:hypothetical protein